MPHDGFRAFGRSTFACGLCGRRTRDTDQNGTDFCQQCYEIMSLDNSVNDNGLTGKERATYVSEAEKHLAIIKKKGGDVAKVKSFNAFLWEA